MFEYTAVVDRVVDGDTIDVIIDLGFSTFKKERVRLYGINAPETRTRDPHEKILGNEAKEALVGVLMSVPYVVLHTHKLKGKYGRFIATVLIPKEDGSLLDINKWLVEMGYAVFKQY